MLRFALAHTSRRVAGARKRVPSAHPKQPNYVRSLRELRYALLRSLSHRATTWFPRNRSVRSIAFS